MQTALTHPLQILSRSRTIITNPKPSRMGAPGNGWKDSKSDDNLQRFYIRLQEILLTSFNRDSLSPLPPLQALKNMKTTVICLSLILGIGTILFAVQETRPDGLIKITKKRIPMDERLLSLCVGRSKDVVGPHAVAEVNIYINQKVQDYRSAHPQAFNYPVGSVFVKEKYSSVEAKSPDIATKMEKVRSEGKISDWEFSMYSLPDKKPIKPTGRTLCASCHERYEERGYISEEAETAMQEFLKK